MNLSSPLPAAVLFSLLLSAAAVLSGCAATETTGTARRPAAGSGADEAMFQMPEGPIARPAGRMTISRIVAQVLPRRSVPYDNMVLPLVSPDGRHMAVQTRIAPTWAMLLAEHDAEPPVATLIEIYRLSDEDVEPQFIAEVREPVLLGRSFDEDGFLIEAPQEDGSRWIGKASWETGEIAWLIADEYVNAFAALGPEGRLAWSRRPVEWPDDHFELVIRHGTEEWTVGSEQETWLMPTWSGRRDGIFVLRLRDAGMLDAVFAIASSEAAFRQSRQRVVLATGADQYSAYQAIGAQVSSPALAAPARDEFVFYHPSQMRMAIWRPMSGRGPAITMLDRDSFAAIIEPEGVAIVTTEENLIAQSIAAPRERAQLLAGIQVPRRTNSAQWPYVLLAPVDDEIGIMLMRPLDSGELEAMAQR